MDHGCPLFVELSDEEILEFMAKGRSGEHFYIITRPETSLPYEELNLFIYGKEKVKTARVISVLRADRGITIDYTLEGTTGDTLECLAGKLEFGKNMGDGSRVFVTYKDKREQLERLL